MGMTIGVTIGMTIGVAIAVVYDWRRIVWRLRERWCIWTLSKCNRKLVGKRGIGK